MKLVVIMAVAVFVLDVVEVDLFEIVLIVVFSVVGDRI